MNIGKAVIGRIITGISPANFNWVSIGKNQIFGKIACLNLFSLADCCSIVSRLYRRIINQGVQDPYWQVAANACAPPVQKAVISKIPITVSMFFFKSCLFLLLTSLMKNILLTGTLKE
jgi:hypothetical protein